jgi:hypothetical protein
MALSLDKLRVGMSLKYLGDHVPAASKFLRGKGEKTGKWLLPHFREDDDKTAWKDLSGIRSSEHSYVIDEIRRGRKDKRGKDLPPLIVLRMEPAPLAGEYALYPKVGLRLEDLDAKFVLTDGFEPHESRLADSDEMPVPPPPIDIAAAVAANPSWGLF